jgi:hypothetical protein
MGFKRSYLEVLEFKMPVLDFKDRAAIAPKPLAWRFAGDGGRLFRIVVIFLVIYLLILEAVNPD